MTENAIIFTIKIIPMLLAQIKTRHSLLFNENEKLSSMPEFCC